MFKDTKQRDRFTVILAAAILFKLSVFAFGPMRIPESIYDSDSATYLQTGETMYSEAIFGERAGDLTFKFETLRTPGYPLFLALLHNSMRIPLLGVIILQILLTILAGLITYKIATEIDYRLGLFSMALTLLDPPVAVQSLRIMTEALYLPLFAWYLYLTVKYLKSGKFLLLALSAPVLIIATFVRPISYFLGLGVALFLIYANPRRSIKKTLIHISLFLIIIYSVLGAWQARNYLRAGTISFSSVGDGNFQRHSLAKNVYKCATPVLQTAGYIGEAGQSFVNLMTMPGSLKYYKSKAVGVAGKIVFYPWMAFWMLGFLVGCFNVRKNIYYRFLLWIMLYFSAVTVINISNAASERFRIPMLPCIAVVSAYGWSIIRDYVLRLRERRSHV
jgi:hypothetical protein